MAYSDTSYNTLVMYFRTDAGDDVSVRLRYVREASDPAMSKAKIGTLMDDIIAGQIFAIGLSEKIGARVLDYEETKIF